MARPSIFTEELGQKICQRISSGESLRSIVKDEEMPSSSSIFRWLLDEDKKEFWEHYEKARNIQAEMMFEEILDIADDGQNDWMEREYKDGSSYITLNTEHFGRSRLRVDTRKWYLSKVLPKKYGDKMDLTSGGKPIPLLNYVRDNDSNTKDTEIKEED